MSAIPGLKKKLKSVRATGKLSQAMKTVSAAKYARLTSVWRNYSRYAEQYRRLFRELDAGGGETASGAETVLVLGSNRGFCGAFNHDLAAYLEENRILEAQPEHWVVCGEELARYLTETGKQPEQTFVPEDIPTLEGCEPLFALLSGFAAGRPDYSVRVIRPFYRNTLTQIPGTELLKLNPTLRKKEGTSQLWLPDADAVLRELKEKGFRTMLFGALLETALGAQAATLMTMRSACDTAAEYSEDLENEIHRLRQSEVTADVIETASERGSKGDDLNG